MKDPELRLRFIELRAQGKSLQTIAEEIGVTRQTLANWESEHQEEIGNRRAMELDALREAYWVTKQRRIELLGESLRRVKEELDRRDLSHVPTVKLFELKLKLSTLLVKEFPAPNIQSERELVEWKALRATFEFPGDPWNPSPERPALLLESEENGNGRNRRRRADAN